MNTKQVIVIRTDLNMRKGKMCSSAAHASLIFLQQRVNLDRPTFLTKAQREWLAGLQRITVLQAPDADELLRLSNEATNLGVEAHRFYDAGLTEVAPDTLTALAIGPDYDSIIDKVTGNLKLL